MATQGSSMFVTELVCVVVLKHSGVFQEVSACLSEKVSKCLNMSINSSILEWEVVCVWKLLYVYMCLCVSVYLLEEISMCLPEKKRNSKTPVWKNIYKLALT